MIKVQLYVVNTHQFVTQLLTNYIISTSFNEMWYFVCLLFLHSISLYVSDFKAAILICFNACRYVCQVIKTQISMDFIVAIGTSMTVYTYTLDYSSISFQETEKGIHACS